MERAIVTAEISSVCDSHKVMCMAWSPKGGRGSTFINPWDEMSHFLSPCEAKQHSGQREVSSSWNRCRQELSLSCSHHKCCASFLSVCTSQHLCAVRQTLPEGKGSLLPSPSTDSPAGTSADSPLQKAKMRGLPHHHFCQVAQPHGEAFG